MFTSTRPKVSLGVGKKFMWAQLCQEHATHLKREPSIKWAPCKTMAYSAEHSQPCVCISITKALLVPILPQSKHFMWCKQHLYCKRGKHSISPQMTPMWAFLLAHLASGFYSCPSAHWAVWRLGPSFWCTTLAHKFKVQLHTKCSETKEIVKVTSRTEQCSISVYMNNYIPIFFSPRCVFPSSSVHHFNSQWWNFSGS